MTITYLGNINSTNTTNWFKQLYTTLSSQILPFGGSISMRTSHPGVRFYLILLKYTMTTCKLLSIRKWEIGPALSSQSYNPRSSLSAQISPPWSWNELEYFDIIKYQPEVCLTSIRWNAASSQLVCANQQDVHKHSFEFCASINWMFDVESGLKNKHTIVYLVNWIQATVMDHLLDEITHCCTIGDHIGC